MDNQTNSLTWLDAILAVWSRWYGVLAAAIIGAAAGLALHAATPKVYQARTEVIPATAGAPLAPAGADLGSLESWRAAQQIPQIGAHQLKQLALSGEAVGRLLDQLGLSQDYSVDQFAGFLDAQVQPGQPGREPPALHLLARARSLDEARRRANLWADVLKSYLDQVARQFIDEAVQVGQRQLAAGNAELEAVVADLHETMNQAQLTLRDQEAFLLRQRYGQYLAYLTSLSLLTDYTDAYVRTHSTSPVGADADYVTAGLEARGQTLRTLRRILAELQPDGDPEFGRQLTEWDRQLSLEAALVQHIQDRLDDRPDHDSLPDNALNVQAMVADDLATVAARLGIAGSRPAERAQRAPQPLYALALRQWAWDPKPPQSETQDDDPDPQPRLGTPAAPVWIPPLMFPADVIPWTDSPQTLMANVRSARIARDTIREQLTSLRERIEKHQADTADFRWKVEQATRRYENARQAHEMLARRVQENRLANLQAGAYLQITSRADRTGRVVSTGLYAHARTGAILGAVLACLVILVQAAAKRKAS